MVIWWISLKNSALFGLVMTPDTAQLMTPDTAQLMTPDTAQFHKLQNDNLQYNHYCRRTDPSKIPRA